MANTTNFGWETPDDTDLVKDGALAIRTLGSAIDTSLVDLKGGTTGQILAKTSNTDMDFTWIANDQGDITAVTAGTGISGGGTTGAVTITNSMATAIDAKGDLIVGTGADTFDRLAVGGTNGHVLTVDSTTSTGIKWAAVAAGGGMTSIASGALSGSAVSLTSISGSYKDLVLVLRNARPTNDNRGTFLRINNDSNANRHIFGTAVTADNQSFNATSAAIQTGTDNTTSNSITYVTIGDYANSSTWKSWQSFSIAANNATATNFDIRRYWGVYNQTGAITQLDLLPEDGTFAGGTYVLYGVN
jgi:hypothetical protein